MVIKTKSILKSFRSLFKDHKDPDFPSVKVPRGGRIVMAACPGAKNEFHQDLHLLQRQKPAIVVSLVENSELKKAGAETLGPQLKQIGIQWFHIPIKDCDTPTNDVRSRWLDLKPLAKYKLSVTKENILLHCWAGSGRAGMMAAKILMQFGMSSDEAVTHVRNAKPDAIDTAKQVQWLNQPNW